MTFHFEKKLWHWQRFSGWEHFYCFQTNPWIITGSDTHAFVQMQLFFSGYLHTCCLLLMTGQWCFLMLSDLMTASIKRTFQNITDLVLLSRFYLTFESKNKTKSKGHLFFLPLSSWNVYFKNVFVSQPWLSGWLCYFVQTHHLELVKWQASTCWRVFAAMYAKWSHDLTVCKSH